VAGPATSKRLHGSDVLRDSFVREVLGERLVGVLATFDAERAIHAVPMWFAADDDNILLATGSGSRKVANLERDTRATLVVHDSRPGFEVCGVSIAGRIEILRGQSAEAPIERVHRRYVAKHAEQNEAVRDFLASDDVALRLGPVSAWIWDERASDASQVLRELGGAHPLTSTLPRA
jgi:nitroimidazol reductase NimA-like FMN-containing flavoprotein (pyridoxamine 5'-phosphate oxidase superfamily)